MAIKRLQNQVASFPRIGKLRKGGKKQLNAQGKEIFGEDLDYFRFDCDDNSANEKFRQMYGDKPDTILVYLPYVTRLENFDSWQESYLAGGLQHRCDGETCTVWLDPKTGSYSQEPKPCPGGCKAVGRLNVIIPALERFAYITVETHSINDILTIESNLDAILKITGTLQGIPFMLKRRNRRISTPGKGGKRISRVKSLMLIEIEENWAALRFTAMQRSSLEMAANAGLLTTGDYTVVDVEPEQLRIVDTKTGEIIEGDAPDATIEIDMDDIEEINPSPAAGTWTPEAANEAPAAGPNPFEDAPVTEVTAPAKPANPALTTLKDNARLRKQFHAVGTETYGDEWENKRFDIVKAKAPAATSSNELTVTQAKELIEGMKAKAKENAAKETAEK